MNGVEQEGRKRSAKVRARLWEKRFRQLAEYKIMHGHTNVPIGWEPNTQLATWVSTQRHEYNKMKANKNTRMTESRIRRLDEIGFVWKLPRGPRKPEQEGAPASAQNICTLGEVSRASLPFCSSSSSAFSPLLSRQSSDDTLASAGIFQKAATSLDHPLTSSTSDALSLMSKAMLVNGSSGPASQKGLAAHLLEVPSIFKHPHPTMVTSSSSSSLERTLTLQSLLLQRKQAEEQQQRAAALLLATTLGSSTSMRPTFLESASILNSPLDLPTTQDNLLAAVLLHKQNGLYDLKY